MQIYSFHQLTFAQEVAVRVALTHALAVYNEKAARSPSADGVAFWQAEADQLEGALIALDIPTPLLIP